MQTFVTINENLIFKSATKLFDFFVPRDKNLYILYYVTDLEDNKNQLMVSYLEKSTDSDYYYLRDIEDDKFRKVSIYIESLLEGDVSKKEIKIINDSYEFEPNTCQTIIEKDRHIDCQNICDFEYALKNISSSYFNSFIYLTDLNDALSNVINLRNNAIVSEMKKENIRGNVNIFLLTLFSVIFLTILIFMAFGLFYHR